MTDLLTTARRHTRLRWVGIGLFWVSLLLFLAAAGTVATGHMPPMRMLVGVMCMGLSLGSFGTANDTALWALRELGDGVPAEFQAEWQEELRLRRARLPSLHGSPKMAGLLPLLTLAAQGFAVHRLWEAWGNG
jgi:hypothetical protein